MLEYLNRIIHDQKIGGHLEIDQWQDRGGDKTMHWARSLGGGSCDIHNYWKNITTPQSHACWCDLFVTTNRVRVTTRDKAASVSTEIRNGLEMLFFLVNNINCKKKYLCINHIHSVRPGSLQLLLSIYIKNRNQKSLSEENQNTRITFHSRGVKRSVSQSLTSTESSHHCNSACPSHIAWLTLAPPFVVTNRQSCYVTTGVNTRLQKGQTAESVRSSPNLTNMVENPGTQKNIRILNKAHRRQKTNRTNQDGACGINKKWNVSRDTWNLYFDWLRRLYSRREWRSMTLWLLFCV